jgi:uncharacterized membrane protein YcaP (DUF421 family)
MENMFFDGWDSLIRTLVVGVMAYCILVAFLRISGKRTLAKMNAFDWVVTVALGSALANILLNKNVALAQGALGLALLIGLQFVVAWSSVRTRWVRGLVAGEPSLLLYRGSFLWDAMQRERVTEEDMHSALRSSGVASPADAEAVVLETDGSFSVIQHSENRKDESSIDRTKGQ